MKITDNEIVMRIPDNWHAHFRQDLLLTFLVPLFQKSGWRGRIAAEPNTDPPLITGERVTTYVRLIEEEVQKASKKPFTVVGILQITETTTTDVIEDAYKRGVRVCKVYPRYVTTNSEHGVVEYPKLYPALKAAESLGMVVQFHPEHPSYDVIGRLKESFFRSILDDIRKECPALKISVEHVSSEDMVDWVLAQPDNVGASVTVHHLYQTADDLNGYSKRSGGLVCVDDGAFKPGAKDPLDREAIRNVVFSGHPRFWYGGDDAAHLKSKKHASRGACGAWNTIPALSLLISLFKTHGKLLELEAFLSEYGAHFYGVPFNEGEITFKQESWDVPLEVVVESLHDSIVPFYAGETMEWKLVD